MAGDTFYVDSRATGDNSGSVNAGVPDENGIVKNAFQSIADIAGIGNLDVIEFGEDSGPYFEAIPNVQNNTVWNGKGIEVNGGVNANTIGAWVASSVDGEWYLDTPLSVEPLCGTVGGYFQMESAEASRQRGTPGSLSFDRQYGWGNADGLGASTLYVRSTINPVLLQVWMAQLSEFTNIAWNNSEFNDFTFAYTNDFFVNAKVTYQYNRCVFKYANNTGFLIANGNKVTLDSCNTYWCGHRAVRLDDAGSTADLLSCTVYESHLIGLLFGDATTVLTMKNSIQVGGEAGAFDNRTGSTASIVEENNCFYPRMTASGGALSYITPAGWVTTHSSSIPPNHATTEALQSNLTDPLFDINPDAYSAEDFELARASVCVGSGQDLTATREPGGGQQFVGINGYPFANQFSDMGSAQSAYHKLHPGHRVK